MLPHLWQTLRFIFLPEQSKLQSRGKTTHSSEWIKKFLQNSSQVNVSSNTHQSTCSFPIFPSFMTKKSMCYCRDTKIQITVVWIWDKTSDLFEKSTLRGKVSCDFIVRMSYEQQNLWCGMNSVARMVHRSNPERFPHPFHCGNGEDVREWRRPQEWLQLISHLFFCFSIPLSSPILFPSSNKHLLYRTSLVHKIPWKVQWQREEGRRMKWINKWISKENILDVV